MKLRLSDMPDRRSDLLLAAGATLLLLAIGACVGFPTLAHSDNDSLLRLAEVRDLLDGQGWFDLHQYRMGPEGGFVMHWSRLVDAPIASIILAFKALGLSGPTAETATEIIWPALLYFLNVYILIRAARVFGGENAVLPAAVIGAAALYFLGIFMPMSLDHHNVQVVLACGSLYLAMAAPHRRFAAFGSGVCAALMLAVGMETVPYVAVLGVTLASMFVTDDRERPIARDFGLGFAGTSALIFVATIPASAWNAANAACDAFSSFHFVMAMIAGGGLALACSSDVSSRTTLRRLVSLACLAAVLGGVLILVFPQCLATPYGNLDPRLKTFWLDNIEEAQSLWQLLATDKASVAARYATPTVAMALMALCRHRGDWRRQDTLVAALLAVAFAVSAWQVRGSTFSIAFAIVPLSAWIGVWRERVERRPSLFTTLRMAAVWIVSVNASWIGIAAAAAAIDGKQEAPTDVVSVAACEGRQQLLRLAAEPPTTVLAVSNLGSPIVAYTGHRAIAALYHRNVEGNLLALDAFLGPAEKAKAIVVANHIGIVAVCPGSPETGLLTQQAPDGFLAGLAKGIVPDWLEPITETESQPMRLYRVRRNG